MASGELEDVSLRFPYRFHPNASAWIDFSVHILSSPIYLPTPVPIILPQFLFPIGFIKTHAVVAMCPVGYDAPKVAEALTFTPALVIFPGQDNPEVGKKGKGLRRRGDQIEIEYYCYYYSIIRSTLCRGPYSRYFLLLQAPLQNALTLMDGFASHKALPYMVSLYHFPPWSYPYPAYRYSCFYSYQVFCFACLELRFCTIASRM